MPKSGPCIKLPHARQVVSQPVYFSYLELQQRS